MSYFYAKMHQNGSQRSPKRLSWISEVLLLKGGRKKKGRRGGRKVWWRLITRLLITCIITQSHSHIKHASPRIIVVIVIVFA